MATLVTKRQRYYIRIRLPCGTEKTISTGTGNQRETERRLKLVEDCEAIVKATMISEAELEDLRLQEATRRFINERRHGSRKLTALAPPVS